MGQRGSSVSLALRTIRRLVHYGEQSVYRQLQQYSSPRQQVQVAPWLKL